MRVFKYASVILLNVVLLLISFYAVWGWIVMAEIRAKSLAKGYDPDKVMDSLLISNFAGNTTIGTNGYSFVPDRLSDKNAYPEFVRIAPEIVLRFIDASNGSTVVKEFEYPLIGPFVRLPNDFVSLLFSICLGYIISTSLLLVKLLRGTVTRCSYIILKPIAGGLAAGGLFLFALSGGKVLIEGSASISSAGVGLLAIVGALSCERFDKLLRKTLSGNGEKQDETK